MVQVASSHRSLQFFALVMTTIVCIGKATRRVLDRWVANVHTSGIQRPRGSDNGRGIQQPSDAAKGTALCSTSPCPFIVTRC